MLRQWNIKTRDEAREAVRELLERILIERGVENVKRVVYGYQGFTINRIADSFEETGEKPTSPFDIPTKEKKKGYTLVYALHQDTGDTGALGIIEEDIYSEGESYMVIALTPEEADEQNRTLPFKDISGQWLIFLLSRKKFDTIRFSKPTTPLSIEEVKTEDGEKRLHTYLYGTYEGDIFPYWDYGFTTEELSKGGIVKGEILDPIPDPDIEDYPDEEDKDWLSNMVMIRPIAPSLLSEATGIKINSREDYLSAVEKVIDAPLDKREKLAVVWAYYHYSRDIFIDYAYYEFFRTESYDHLKEILSRYSDFGLSEDWETNMTGLIEQINVRLSIYDVDTKVWTPITTEEAIISIYLNYKNTSEFGGISFKELSQETGIPVGLLSKASKLEVDWRF